MNRSRLYLPKSLRWLADALPSILGIVLFLGASIAFIQSSELENLAQPLAGVLISFVVVSTICWEWKVLGNPRSPEPLIAHITLFVAVFFMINALYKQAEGVQSLIGVLLEAFAWTSKILTGIPDAVFDIIRSPSIAILFLGICLSLAVPRRTWAIGLLTGVGGLAVAWGFSKGIIDSPVWFCAGLVLLGAGIAVLSRNFRLEIFWEEVRKRLAGDEAVRGDLELKIRLLRKLEKERRPLGAEDCIGCVARAMAMDETNPLVRDATIRVARQMVYQDNLADLSDHRGAKALTLSRSLFLAGEGDDAWSAIARWPKVIVVILITTLWVLSPVDLIPDATPIIGVVDDVMVALLGFSMMRVRTRPEDSPFASFPKIGGDSM